jgi:hypothetical protein
MTEERIPRNWLSANLTKYPQRYGQIVVYIWTIGNSGLTHLGSTDKNEGKQRVQGAPLAAVNDEFNNLANSQIAQWL